MHAERIQQFEEQLHQELQQEIDSNEENSDNDVGEGSSTSVHIKKIGKKKGEKLKRKEAKRQYREVKSNNLILLFIKQADIVFGSTNSSKESTRRDTWGAV